MTMTTAGRALLLSTLLVAGAATTTAPRLSDWMGDLLPIIGNSTLFDLTVVETHNTGSQRMTTTISDNSEQVTAAEAAALHDLTATRIGAATVGRFTQLWAVVQAQDFIDQLDAGVRSIDFRMIWSAPWNESSSHPHDFYINHRAQTKETAMWYLREVRKWMDAHPSEILRMHITRHAGDTFPGTPDSALQTFFSDFVELFQDVLHDHARYPSANTTLSSLVQTKQRLHVSVAAYASMTRNGTARGSNLVNEVISQQQCGSYPILTELHASLPGTVAACFTNTNHKDGKTLTSLALNRDPEIATYVAAGEVFAAGKLAGVLGLVRKCAKTLNFGSMLSGKWCPGSVLEYEHLQGYWDQFLLEEYVNNYTKPEVHLPNIIAVNAFGLDGTLEIDSGGKRYALVDTTLLANVRQACREGASESVALCEETERAILVRHSKFPIQRMQDTDRGRQPNLPPAAMAGKAGRGRIAASSADARVAAEAVKAGDAGDEIGRPSTQLII